MKNSITKVSSFVGTCLLVVSGFAADFTTYSTTGGNSVMNMASFDPGWQNNYIWGQTDYPSVHNVEFASNIALTSTNLCFSSGSLIVEEGDSVDLRLAARYWHKGQEQWVCANYEIHNQTQNGSYSGEWAGVGVPFQCGYQAGDTFVFRHELFIRVNSDNENDWAYCNTQWLSLHIVNPSE